MREIIGMEFKSMLYRMAKDEGLGEESAGHFVQAVVLFIGWLFMQT